MKTLDEVITIMDGIDQTCTCCAYQHDCDETECVEKTALHYLKEYRSEKAMWEADRKGYLDWIEQYKEAREKHQQAVIELKKNPPLTWQELQRMECKPVYVVYHTMRTKGWALVDYADDDRIDFTTPSAMRLTVFERQMGKIWQAYRKERS